MAHPWPTWRDREPRTGRKSFHHTTARMRTSTEPIRLKNWPQTSTTQHRPTQSSRLEQLLWPKSKCSAGRSQLYCRQIYGIEPNVNPGVLAIDDSSIVYVSGHNVVIFNVESKQYRYIQGKHHLAFLMACRNRGNQTSDRPSRQPQQEVPRCVWDISASSLCCLWA